MTRVNEALEAWCRKLEAHFSALARDRREAGLPVFAIEHGLDDAELSDISALLHQRLDSGEPLGVHWLLWVVYAAELGYKYDGEEYWPSFEQRTPHWRRDMHRREQLRQWFIKFHKTYEGVRPTGPWATQFSIIAWPITHAVLPKDLQTQLARILYEQRYFVAEFIDETPIQVGRLIAASAYDASSRLRIFLEQEELAGRIVLALLGSSEQQATGSILKSALQRIVSDLEEARDAREWLREARSAVAGVKVRLGAKAGPQSGNGTDGVHFGTAAERVESKSIQPRLVLIREALDSWNAVLELPSFIGVASLNAHYATFLRKNRCMVAGTGSTWNPKGWLLYGTQKRKLISWPDPSKPVVRFEDSDAAVVNLLQADCRISEGPIWLFRINKDGTASEAIGRQVRVDHDYVLLHKTPVEQHPYLRPNHLSCDGIMASVLSIPRDAPDEALRGLAKVGLRLTRALRIWPAGLPPARWDGEGRAEWLLGDNVCIGLSHEGLCEGFSVRFDGHKEPTIVAELANQPTFLNLGRLSVGTHTLGVTATYHNLGAQIGLHRTDAEATLTILVRPPHRWVPGTSSHVGLIVSTEPYEPTLDALLGGQVRVSILGPEGRTVKCGLEFLDAADKILAFEPLGTIRIPMAPGDWRNIVDERGRNETDPSHYLRASAGRLVIDGEDLGCTRVRLSHSVVPIRWLAQSGQGIVLRLVDDTAHEDPIKVEVASFRNPTSPTELVLKDSSNLISPSGLGGLYLAIAGSHRVGVVVSVPRRVHGLQELADRPDLVFSLRDGAAVESLLKWIRDWSRARIVGPLAAQRRAIAVRGMEDQLFATVCRAEWIRAERRYREDGPLVPNAHEWLENVVDSSVSFALSLSRAKGEVLSESIDTSAKSLLAHAVRYRICSSRDHTLCEAALRLAAAPAHFSDWAGPRIAEMLDELSRRQPLVRGARMLILVAGDDERRKLDGWFL